MIKSKWLIMIYEPNKKNPHENSVTCSNADFYVGVKLNSHEQRKPNR